MNRQLLRTTYVARHIIPVHDHIGCCPFSQTYSSKKRLFSSPSKPDPLAKRPNKVCDPYGQGGKPLAGEEASQLLSTLEDGWSLDDADTPKSIVREYRHENYLNGSAFISKIAAVGEVNNHYPCLSLERKLLPRRWQVTTTVRCQTPTLGGLSSNDFYVAMLIEVETSRPEIKKLLQEDEPVADV